MPSSRGPSRPRDRTRVSASPALAGAFFTTEPPMPSQMLYRTLFTALLNTGWAWSSGSEEHEAGCPCAGRMKAGRIPRKRATCRSAVPQLCVFTSGGWSRVCRVFVAVTAQTS